MNYRTTAELLEILKPYIANANISICSENKDWKNRDYKSDLVTIDEKQHVGFEVFENEIIVYYFTDHCHFEDYTSEFDEGAPDYLKRAKEFLLNLFQYQIRHMEFYRGKTKSSEKYYLIYDDGREDECIGNTWFGLERFINPFGKKSREMVTWIYDKEKGHFANQCPKSPSPEAVQVVDISDECYIEIFQGHNAYTYEIMELDYDDYFGMYYWAPACDIIPSGFYDTKEKAVEYAMDALKCRRP